MSNLLKETIDIMAMHGKLPSDVMWVGTEKFWTTWENFKNIANEHYDSGFGSQKVASDLMIVGHDWWMTRGEYDGSEWWNFHNKPSKPLEMRKFEKIVGGMWDSVVALNEWEDEKSD